MPVTQTKSLPELLVERKMLTVEQVRTAQAKAAASGLPLRRVISQLGLVSDDQLTELLAKQHGMTTADLATLVIKPELIHVIPEALARKHTLLPMFKIGETLTVVVADPLNFFALDEVRMKTQ